jgi:hypothetical protein
MYMIEKMTGHTFEYEKTHKVLKIVVDLREIGVPITGPGGAAVAAEVDAPLGGAAAGAASPLSCSPSCSSSPIRKFFSSIFGMCKDIQVRQ